MTDLAAMTPREQATWMQIYQAERGAIQRRRAGVADIRSRQAGEQQRLNAQLAAEERSRLERQAAESRRTAEAERVRHEQRAWSLGLLGEKRGYERQQTEEKELGDLAYFNKQAVGNINSAQSPEGKTIAQEFWAKAKNIEADKHLTPLDRARAMKMLYAELYPSIERADAAYAKLGTQETDVETELGLLSQSDDPVAQEALRLYKSLEPALANLTGPQLLSAKRTALAQAKVQARAAFTRSEAARKETEAKEKAEKKAEKAEREKHRANERKRRNDVMNERVRQEEKAERYYADILRSSDAERKEYTTATIAKKREMRLNWIRDQGYANYDLVWGADALTERPFPGDEQPPQPPQQPQPSQPPSTTTTTTTAPPTTTTTAPPTTTTAAPTTTTMPPTTSDWDVVRDFWGNAARRVAPAAETAARHYFGIPASPTTTGAQPTTTTAPPTTTTMPPVTTTTMPPQPAQPQYQPATDDEMRAAYRQAGGDIAKAEAILNAMGKTGND